MSDAVTLYNEVYCNALHQVDGHDLSTDEAAATLKNLKILSECHPPVPIPEPEEIPEPTTLMGKLKAGTSGVWDNETTRVLIKASGAFAGVVIVTWATVHRDHVVTREALSQANQRIS